MRWPRSTQPEDLPTEFAVFPLPGALLLPRGRLPLNIFEPRYLAMTEDALANGRMFGMIQPDPTLPETANGPGLYRVGCLGRLSSFSETDDGRLLITLTGLIRFSIASEIDMRRGYRRVRGDFSRYRGRSRASRRPAAIDREAMLTALRGYFARRGVEAELGRDQPAAGRCAGRDPGHGLPVRADRETGAAGSARPRRSAPRRCSRCCAWVPPAADGAPGGRTVS